MAAIVRQLEPVLTHAIDLTGSSANDPVLRAAATTKSTIHRKEPRQQEDIMTMHPTCITFPIWRRAIEAHNAAICPVSTRRRRDAMHRPRTIHRANHANKGQARSQLLRLRLSAGDGPTSEACVADGDRLAFTQACPSPMEPCCSAPHDRA